MEARKLHINGIVQGVGFRPHVVRLARSLGCCGWVLNNTHGVTIHIQHTDSTMLDTFERRVIEDAPSVASITRMNVLPTSCIDTDSFVICASSKDDEKSTLISPDLAVCDTCIEELFDPQNRRYHYPFINCTNCGPRFTIINDLPYDRENTSMHNFKMCTSCAQEYTDDENRRYHAQPNACFKCGPRLWLLDASQSLAATFDDNDALMLESALIAREESDALIAQAIGRLKDGDILAIKGLGGWHLACDATNTDAVARLRKRKHRPSKALAVMVCDLEAAHDYAQISEEEAALLTSVERPIVLLKKCNDAGIAHNVVGELSEIGIMLPSTPLHYLLMHEAGIPLVMTSANRSGEPIVASDKDAIDALGDIADGFLGNNRAIVARYDDSVMRVLEDGTQMIRRARGFAPAPLHIESTSDQNKFSPVIFAAGPEQKVTFTFLENDQAFVSQHLGDLEHLGAMNAYEEAYARYKRLFDFAPQAIACDMHPEYLSTKRAIELAAANNIEPIEVQHHHAHIASVLGENSLHEPVIGIALDGTGYGIDNTIWGGEILIATRTSFERFWHLPQFKLPGGAAAIKQPERSAYAMLCAFGKYDDPFFGQFSLDNPQFADFLQNLKNRELLGQMLEKDVNSPVCSSVGRMFDAVSALLGICTNPSYDGEAACLLEAAAHRNDLSDAPFTARTFHDGLIEVIINSVLDAKATTGINSVALSGGCMANRIIFSQLNEKLYDLGFAVYANHNLPPNDGCISYGQAIVARARLEE